MASNDTKDRENLNPADNYWSDGNVFQGDAKSNRLKNAEEEAASDNSNNILKMNYQILMMLKISKNHLV